jgi:hypothetical protein
MCIKRSGRCRYYPPPPPFWRTRYFAFDVLPRRPDLDPIEIRLDGPSASLGCYRSDVPRFPDQQIPRDAINLMHAAKPLQAESLLARQDLGNARGGAVAEDRTHRGRAGRSVQSGGERQRAIVTRR